MNGAYSGEVNVDDEADGKGVFVLDDGDIYDGSFRDGYLDGVMTTKWSDGAASVESHKASAYGYIYDGEGTYWNKDRSAAWRMMNGQKKESISLEEAMAIMAKLGVTKIPSRYPIEEDRA